MAAAEFTSVLVVDDEENIRNLIALTLRKEGYKPTSAADGEAALAAVEKLRPDLVLLDVNLPKKNGIEVLREIRRASPRTTVIMVSAYGSFESIIEAVKLGAADYVNKPFKREELLLAIEKTAQRERLRRENTKLRERIAVQGRETPIVGQNPRIRELLATVEKVARVKTTVLVLGESGTGKELVARMIHERSDRRGRPFVAVNCGAIPEQLIESELFGHVRGAFTDASRDRKGLFEEAQGGTLFLDEVGELPAAMQVKLLRVLQEEEIRRVGDTKAIPVDVRIVGATAVDLQAAVEDGRFRDDLFFRLNVFSVTVPPLRERADDVPRLVEWFRERFNDKLGLAVAHVAPDAMDQLQAYHWPGNVRELENTIERAMILADGDTIRAGDLPAKITARAKSGGFRLDEDECSIKQATHRLESELIRRALTRTRGNRTAAAKLLEISHRALLYKIKEYGVTE